MFFPARLIRGVILAAALFSAGAVSAADVLVTSSGQALDAFTVKTLLGRGGIENDYDPHATAEMAGAAKVVIIAVGASVKGFGAAGITTETELERTRQIIDAAQAADARIIGVHIGGEERRGGLSEQFIDLVSGAADALVVWAAGNEDGYFDRVAAERDVPVIVIGKLAELTDAIKQVSE